MCFGNSKDEDDAGVKKNAEIEKLIKQDQKKDAREVKILLLGTPASIMTSRDPHSHAS